MYARHGGFVEGAEFFDSGFFGMSAAEAKTIDPQQRLALEMSYAACHHAGRAKQSLLGSDTGVFVGQCLRNSGRQKPRTQSLLKPLTRPQALNPARSPRSIGDPSYLPIQLRSMSVFVTRFPTLSVPFHVTWHEEHKRATLWQDSVTMIGPSFPRSDLRIPTPVPVHMRPSHRTESPTASGLGVQARPWTRPAHLPWLL